MWHQNKCEEIAKVLGTTATAVYCHAHKMNLNDCTGKMTIELGYYHVAFTEECGRLLAKAGSGIKFVGDKHDYAAKDDFVRNTDYSDASGSVDSSIGV
jgi:hypothetical protein